MKQGSMQSKVVGYDIQRIRFGFIRGAGFFLCIIPIQAILKEWVFQKK
jgi:hypothetical protein